MPGSPLPQPGAGLVRHWSCRSSGARDQDLAHLGPYLEQSMGPGGSKWFKMDQNGANKQQVWRYRSQCDHDSKGKVDVSSRGQSFSYSMLSLAAEEWQPEAEVG